MKTLISFRLRKELDEDLIKLNIPEDEIADVCRNGLRLMLGIRMTKQIEVKEKPIVTLAATDRQSEQKEKTVQIPGKAAVFMPTKSIRT